MTEPNRFYVTTAIPYVNGSPHVGHALEAVQTDALARYHRYHGDDTYFLTGSDDNSIKNVMAAEREGVAVGDLVARNTEDFIRLDQALDISYDQFIRTSVDEQHLRGAQKLWRAVEQSGDIYTKAYRGLYCPSCEQFYDEDELEKGLCPEHLIPPETVEETNYFFKLSRYQDELERLIESDTYRVIPQHRKNEVLSFIRSGLQDFSISRSMQRARGWGIPVPNDPTQVMYVWFDALSNYITALGYADEGELYRRYWVDNPARVHVIGKGIIRFHAVYWPAMLLSAHVPLPHVLFVHGYYTVEGHKMGKSMGNAVGPIELVERYGSDPARYYFLAATPPTADTDFSLATFEARYSADLANDLGNLVNRVITMVVRYRDGVIPSATGTESALLTTATGLPSSIAAAMEEYDFQRAVASIWSVVTQANRFIEAEAPWKLAKEESAAGPGESVRARLDWVLGTLAETLWRLSLELTAFLPHTGRGIRQQLGLPEAASSPSWTFAAGRVAEPSPMFPRLAPVPAYEG